MSDEPHRPSAVALLKANGLYAKKSFGQNFLLDANAARKIAEAATTPAGGMVLEIGAGLGALTRPLLGRAKRVIAVERDRDLVPILRAELSADIEGARLDVVEADALALDWTALLADAERPRALAGNLPYLLTGRFLERAISVARDIDVAVFMLQLEVAERLSADPSTKAYGALTVFTRAAFEVERLVDVRAGSFHPRPDVDSAVVVLRPRQRIVEETGVFRELVRAAFGQRRKTLRNAWRAVNLVEFSRVEGAAATANVDLGRRGETLSVEEFETLARLASS